MGKINKKPNIWGYRYIVIAFLAETNVLDSKIIDSLYNMSL